MQNNHNRSRRFWWSCASTSSLKGKIWNMMCYGWGIQH
jgi:hypothetical protein